MALRIAGLTAATGALAGAIEGFAVSVTVKLLLSAWEVLQLVLAAVVLDAALGAVFGIVGGAVAQLLLTRLVRPRRYRAGFTLACAGLVAFFLGPLARDLWATDQRAAAAGMVALALLFVANVWFNAGYWFKREMIGAGPALGWKAVCGAGVAVMAVLAMGLGGTPWRGEPPPVPLPPDTPNLVLLTIDTLRRDHVGAYGSVVSTPVLDALAREGLVADDAITPTPETAPSHASMMTGQQPVNHRVLANGIRLRGGWVTVAEYLEAAGYRPGAFVSSFAVDAQTGLAQGFEVYDDDFVPFARGVSEVRLARVGLPLLLRFGDPARFPWLLERGGKDTIAAALAWVDEVGADPFFLWVHLFEPHAPYERHDGQPNEVDHRAILAQEPGYAYSEAERASLRALYRHEVEYTDALAGTLIEGLKARGALDGGLVVVVADHGEALGEHGYDFEHHGLGEEVLRVPMIAWSPTPRWEPGTRIPAQTTVGDVANTLISWAGLPGLTETESLPLTAHLDAEVKTKPVILVGRAELSLSEGQLCGMRAPGGAKCVAGEDGVRFHDLAKDPAELHDIAEEQPRAVATCREMLARLPPGTCTGVDMACDARLKALGYCE